VGGEERLPLGGLIVRGEEGLITHISGSIFLLFARERGRNVAALPLSRGRSSNEVELEVLLH